jgi:alpha-tubulin suppressor-like RCC1 family protein
VQVYGTYWDTIALKENGTVLAVGGMTKDCDFSTWEDIVAIAVDDFHYAGLKSNGTVVALGVDSDGRLKVNTWTNIDIDIINIIGK